MSGRALGEYLTTAVTPFVPAELISPNAFLRIQAAAGALPGAMTDFFGFECPLGTDEPLADFLICCRIRHGSREFLASQMPDALRERPVWSRVAAFACEWTKLESPLFHGVHNLWFEFDLNRGDPPEAAPSVFLGSDRLGRSSPEECAWLTDLALPLLLGHELDPAVRRQVTRSLGLLPPEARLFQIGLMLSRPSAPVRLCLRGIPHAVLGAYLKELDWPGSTAELEPLLAALGEHAERIDLDFDAANRIQPKIGLECYLGPGRARLSRFLDYLVASEFCTAQKAQAIELWSGMTDGPEPPDGDGRRVFIRAFHHAKIVYEPGAPVQAKAYLGVHHRRLSQEEFERALRGEALGAGGRLKGRTPPPETDENPPVWTVVL